MIKWAEIELGTVAKYGKDKIDAEYLNSENYISTDNMLQDKQGISASEYVPSEGRASKFKKGDILVSNIRPYFKKIWFAKNDGGCSNDVIVFKSEINKVEPKFLYYQLSKDEFFDFMMAGANGTKMPRGNKDSIPTYKLLLPPLPTQRKIASILSAYDDLIENNLKRIKLLEELAQRTYEEWFIKFRINGKQLKINTESGLPEGWEKKKLKNILTLNYGKSLKADERIKGDFPVYGSSGIVGSHNCSLVSCPGIILGRKGNVGSVFWSEKKFYPIDTVYYVASEISFYFIYFNLKSQSFINNDAAVPGLNRNAAYMMDSFLPSREILDSFDKFIKPTFDVIENLQNQIHLLKESRDILLPRLMSGNIEVA